MNSDLRDKMNRVAGMIEALRFPIIVATPAYYDLIDSIAEQYEAIMKEVKND